MIHGYCWTLSRVRRVPEFELWIWGEKKVQGEGSERISDVGKGFGWHSCDSCFGRMSIVGGLFLQDCFKYVNLN